MILDKEHKTRRESAVITPGELRVREEPTTKFSLENLEAATVLTRYWKMEPKTRVPVKTFGPGKGELHYTDGSGSIGTLDDITVTLIRLTNPNTGAVSIQMSLEYFATSNGSRTPDGRTLPGATSSYNPGRETYKVNHWVYLRTATGGLVYTWWVGQDFQLDCGWNRQHCLHGRIETNILDWFDAVERYNWEISGLFYRC